MPTLYEHYNTGDETYISVYGVYWKTQTFTPSLAHKITTVKLKMHRIGLPGIITVSIRATDGDGKPTGPDLCSGTIDGNTLTASYLGAWDEIRLGVGCNLSADTKYAIVVRAPSGNVDNQAAWRVDYEYIPPDPSYIGGSGGHSIDSGSSWTMRTDWDLMFEEEEMPGFLPGELKTAIITMGNPTGSPFDYSAELYMGTNLALMASKDFHLEAGESKDISLPITMPSVSGTYPVYIGVFSGGVAIPPVYQAEDVVIAALPDVRVENLTITPSEVYVREKVTISVQVTNYGSASGSKRIVCTVS